MSDKILYAYLGKTSKEQSLSILDLRSDNDINYMIDSDLRNSINKDVEGLCGYTDFFDERQIQEKLDNWMPAKHIVVCPTVDSLLDLSSADENLRVLLQKVFSLTKMLYLPVMRYRQSMLWYLDFTPIYLEKNPQCGVLMESFSKGLDAVSKVAALELSRKKILVNSIKVTNQDYLPDLISFLAWSGKRKMYLTAQSLTL
ncbi:hypothetical protein [Ruminiclostridium josui]|nr:hypothetical protein [Ruminiclostridium josui]